MSNNPVTPSPVDYFGSCTFTDQVFYLYNTNNRNKVMKVAHRLTLRKCSCDEVEEDSCIFYTVGYNIDDLCASLGLDKEKPICMTSPTNMKLEIITNHGIFGEGPLILIPVHRNSHSMRGIHNHL
jgi:hypothetical protein